MNLQDVQIGEKYEHRNGIHKDRPVICIGKTALGNEVELEYEDGRKTFFNSIECERYLFHALPTE